MVAPPRGNTGPLIVFLWKVGVAEHSWNGDKRGLLEESARRARRAGGVKWTGNNEVMWIFCLDLGVSIEFRAGRKYPDAPGFPIQPLTISFSLSKKYI